MGQRVRPNESDYSRLKRVGERNAPGREGKENRVGLAGLESPRVQVFPRSRPRPSARKLAFLGKQLAVVREKADKPYLREMSRVLVRETGIIRGLLSSQLLIEVYFRARGVRRHDFRRLSRFGLCERPHSLRKVLCWYCFTIMPVTLIISHITATILVLSIRKYGWDDCRLRLDQSLFSFGVTLQSLNANCKKIL